MASTASMQACLPAMHGRPQAGSTLRQVSLADWYASLQSALQAKNSSRAVCLHCASAKAAPLASAMPSSIAIDQRTVVIGAPPPDDAYFRRGDAVNAFL